MKFIFLKGFLLMTFIMAKNRKLIFIAGSIIAFIILALVYANPVLTGKQLFQHDIVQYKGGAKELLDYRAQNGRETYWSDSMFGGMPTYQMGAQFRGDIIKKVDDLLNFLPKASKAETILSDSPFHFPEWIVPP